MDVKQLTPERLIYLESCACVGQEMDDGIFMEQDLCDAIYDELLIRLKELEATKDLIQAADRFIGKVDNGWAHSVHSYGEFNKALAAIRAVRKGCRG